MLCSRCLVYEVCDTCSFNDNNAGYRAAILKKNYLFYAAVLYGCGYLLLLRKGAQNDAYCNCVVVNISLSNKEHSKHSEHSLGKPRLFS